MLKRWLASVLTLALLLSTLGSFTSLAVTAAKFAYVSYESGVPLYKNAAMSVDTVTAKGGATSMPAITENDTDEYAHFMAHHNDQLGINVPASLGIGTNAVIEVTVWADADNQTYTRLGLNYSSVSGQTDYGAITLSGDGQAMSVLDGATAEVVDMDGWKIFKITMTDADFNVGGQVNLVKWSHDNKDTTDGWHIKSLLVYDAESGKPDTDDLYIRRDTVGHIDFSAAEAEAHLLGYTAEGAALQDMDDGLYALKLNDKAFTVRANEAPHPAVLSTDAAVSVLAEVKFGEGAWQVVRRDITDNADITFDLATLLFGDVSEDIYIRKVVVARTPLIATYTNTDAFVDFALPYALYPDFSRVTATAWRMAWGFEGGADEHYEINADDGKAAIYANGGYWWLNADDAFTKNGTTNVADLGLEITYLDKGTGTLKMQYNRQIPEGQEDALVHQFADQTIVALENTNEWKTVKVYLSDAQFRNAANGADFRIPMGDLAGAAIASVKLTIGADKTVLNELIATIESQYRPAVVNEPFDSIYAAARAVRDDPYATKAQVDKAVADLTAMLEELTALSQNDPRYTAINTDWYVPESGGAIVLVDGWYCWQFTLQKTGNWLGIRDKDGMLSDATSVTYEYEILMDTQSGNDRFFLAHGTENGWQDIREGAPPEGNGFAAGGHWGDVPTNGTWGVVRLVNDHFDPQCTSDRGNIAEIGSWVEEGTLYVGSIKVYDTNDPTKYISLRFNEDVEPLTLSGSDTEVTLTEKDGFAAYAIPSGWKSLNIDVKDLIDRGVLSKDTEQAVVEFVYFLEETDNPNELLMVKHYNPEGTGDNDDKTTACEHQAGHRDLIVRDQWVRAKFLLDDCRFDADNKTLNITYGNGANVYIRGVRVYALNEDGYGRPAQWGDMNAPFIPHYPDFVFCDWDIDFSFGMNLSFADGSTPTAFRETDGRMAAIITDDRLYVDVDENVFPTEERYLRIDIAHQNGATMYVRYNKLLPDGIDDSTEPHFTQYRLHASGENEVVKDGVNTWITTEDEFVNALGVVMPTDTSSEWTVTSIYLSDAQLRNAANGFDFCIQTLGGAVISRVEVHAITEAEYDQAAAAVGDMTALKDYYNAVLAQYGDTLPTIYKEALDAAAAFIRYNYRATGQEIDAALTALQAVVSPIRMGDVDGNGDVTTSDARKILLYCAGNFELPENAAVADVNGDGVVNTTDARFVLRYCADLIERFPTEM